jgi:pimeloyl-ACP methyl ester carboxylesterase
MPLGTTYLFAAAPFLTSKLRLQQFVHNALGPATRRGRPEIAERLAAAKQASPQSETAWRAQVAAGMLFNPLGRQRDLTQPTLVMQGTADQVVDPSNADVLADLLPNAGVELLDGAGHLLYWEQPRRFARVVAGFLNEPATSTRRLTRPVRRAS